MKRKEKIIPEPQHRYNLFSGFALATQIAAILYFLTMVRYSVVELSFPPKIDFIILGILIVTSIFQELITKQLFVIKHPIPILSGRDKIIVFLLIIVWLLIVLILIYSFKFINWDSSVGVTLREEWISMVKGLG